MRLAVICKSGRANSHYRALLPMRELERRGHTVCWPGDPSFGVLAARGVPPWDLFHVHQFIDPSDLDTVRRLRRQGVAVVWDTDDDISAVPKGTDPYRRLGGRRGVRTAFARSVEIAAAAHLVTTTNEHLADVYRSAGVEHVAVIENHLAPWDLAGARPRHQGVVIGLVASAEHAPDLARLRIASVLGKLLDAHPDLRVQAIGLDVGLADPRYTHVAAKLPFERLIELERGFDIGIAPLADSPMSRARSNVKLKEYAAAGAAWLASPVGPYVGLGEEQGGLLVPDGDWPEALDLLVRDLPRRRALAKQGAAWARRQTIQHAGDAWESAFRAAVQRARRVGRRSAPPV